MNISDIKDWLWFWLILHGNEFNKSLDLDITAVLNGSRSMEEELMRISLLRNRAHKLDMKYRH
jgi:hypothetical protein